MKKMFMVMVSLALALSMIFSMAVFAEDAAVSEGEEAVAAEDAAVSEGEEAVAAEGAEDVEGAEDEEEEIVIPDRINILLLGLSGESEYDTNRTDSMLLVTVDNEFQQLKFTSILRDSQAYIEGYGYHKINAANRYGGPELMMQTINDNFGLELEDYIIVNFNQFANIVDQLGGVNITLTEAEANYLINDLGGYYTAGETHLNGIETLEYSRIRKIDSDVERSNRQRQVLKEFVRIVSEMEPEGYLELMLSFLDLVEDTSLDADDIKVLMEIPFWDYEIINNHVPDTNIDENVGSGISESTGEWVWIYDLAVAGERIKDIIENKQFVEYWDAETVAEVQEALNEAGFDCGDVDGSLGEMTKAAIESYQEANGIDVTGTITNAVLESFGIEKEN